MTCDPILQHKCDAAEKKGSSLVHFLLSGTEYSLRPVSEMSPSTLAVEQSSGDFGHGMYQIPSIV